MSNLSGFLSAATNEVQNKKYKIFRDMKRKKIVRIIVLGLLLAVVVGGSVGAYMFFKPHRDVVHTKADMVIDATVLVNEYLTDADRANEKYLDEGGQSKILEVSGTVADIDEDFNQQMVVLLKSEGAKAGVSATFTPETNASVAQLKLGDKVHIKGVIRSGAAFDEDFGFYENVIMEKSNLVK